MKSALHRPSFIARLFTSPLDWLLLAVPIAFCVRYVPDWRQETVLFVVAGIGIIPLAGWMGRATEHLAEQAGHGIGGLLNATFGNAAELIIALMALSKGLVGVVKASITGSIIGNILLVLGASILAGGLRFPKQTFNRTLASSSATTLSLAAIALLIPTVFHVTAKNRPGGWSPAAEQNLSLGIAVVLLVTYALLMVFYLVTHQALFVGQSPPPRAAECADSQHWSLTRSILLLLISTALVAVLSEFLVGSVESARTGLGLSEIFVGVVIVAVIGNAAEHSTAIMAALKDNMNLSLSVAIGSSLQVALFLTPILIFASYGFGAPMNLEFSLPEVVVIALSIWIMQQICTDGESNWLEGVQLLAVYLVMAILFFFLPEPDHRRLQREAQSTASPYVTVIDQTHPQP